MVSYKEALAIILSKKITTETALIPLLESIGNFLSEDIRADRNYPPFNRASMDGIAFYWDGTSAFHKSYSVKGTVYAGEEWTQELQSGECIRIMTGAPVPKQLNVLVRVEDIVQEDKSVYLKANLSLKLMQNIAKEGEDIKQGGLVISKGKRITIQQTGTLSSMGYALVPAYKNINAAIIRTGNEIIEPDRRSISTWQIRDSNSYSIRSFLRHYPISFNVFSAQDSLQALMLQIEENKNNKILILTGGVSAGNADYVPEALFRCGFTCHFHKVMIKPGKPIWFGTHPNGCVAFGLPGNPYSVQVGIKIFIEPFIRSCFTNNDLTYTTEILTHSRIKNVSFDEFILGKKDAGGIRITKHNGSGDIAATSMSEGIVHHPANSEELKAGESIHFYPWIKND